MKLVLVGLEQNIKNTANLRNGTVNEIKKNWEVRESLRSARMPLVAPIGSCILQWPDAV